MKCLYCNTEHPSSMLYCPNTGQRLEHIVSCPNCGNSNIPSSARYCPNCGNVLKSPDKENIREFVSGGRKLPNKKHIHW